MQHDASPETQASRPEANGAERRCLVRAVSGPTSELIRFAVAPDGMIVPDITEKLPGRGLWVTANASCLETAIGKKLFGRAAGQQVTIPPTLVEDTAALLAKRVKELLGLAKKAALLVTGADAVRDAAGKGKLSYVLIGADASAAGAADMTGRRDTPTLRLPLSAAELGAALGRDNTVYVGLLPGRLANALIRDVTRLNGIVNKDLDE